MTRESLEKGLAIWPTSPHLGGAVRFRHRHRQDTSLRTASPYPSTDIRPSDTERVRRVVARPSTPNARSRSQAYAGTRPR